MSKKNTKRKKKKLSKKLQEKKSFFFFYNFTKLGREEEERRRLEEEERLRIEEEKRKKREEEEERRRKAEEERKRKEMIRLNSDEKDFLPRTNLLEKKLKKQKAELFKVDSWKSYLECSALPCAKNMSEINSFLSLWRDSFASPGKKRNIYKDFKECEEALELYYKIEEELFVCTSQEQRNSHKVNMMKVAKATLDTLDDVTAHIMQFSDVYVDSSSSQFFYSCGNFTYSLWLNLLKNPRIKNIEFEGMGASVHLVLKGSHMLDYGIRVIRFKNDFLSLLCSKEKVLFSPVGGIVYVDFLNMPPAPVTKSGWTIRKVTKLSTKVERRPYKEVDIHKRLVDPPPTKVSFTVPNDVVLRKDVPRVAWWDEELMLWSQEGIPFESVKFDQAKKRVFLNTTHLTTALAVVHSRTFDVPFRKWFLTPVPELGRNCVVLSITPKLQTNSISQIPNIIFLISDDKCSLLSPKMDQLSFLNENYFYPRVLLQRMADSGINLILSDSDKDNTDRSPKLMKLEKKIYSHISYLASLITITSSKWNHDINISDKESIFRISSEIIDPRNAKLIEEKPKCLLKDVLEMFDFDLKDDEDWDTVLYDVDKCCFINCSEKSENIDLSPLENLETEINLTVAIEKKLKNNQLEDMIAESCMLTAKTIEILLTAIRPLSWC